MHAIGIESQPGRFLPKPRCPCRKRWQDDDLADVSGILHQPEGIADLVMLEGAKRQRREDALLEELADLAEQPPRQCGLQHQKLVGIDAEIADIAAERPQADLAVGIIIALAKLEEASERLDQRQRFFHRLAKQ